ncbi:hypothetical protein [Streptomyces aureocirculatus]|nr:hypothetical protein [Streptomyces aureocirculatus]
MPLRDDMPTRAPDDQADPEQATDYQASRGGWYPTDPKPVPGTPKGTQ